MGVGMLAVEVLSEAIERSVLTATSLGGVPAVSGDDVPDGGGEEG
jgi:hypothetical protein